LSVFAYKSSFMSLIHPPFMCAQVLRSAVHNYPSCANMIWEKLRDNVLNLLQIQSFEDQKYDANFGPPGAKEESSIKGRCLVAGIKVMFSVLVG
jgi:HEAT repeat-containing protein 6